MELPAGLAQLPPSRFEKGPMMQQQRHFAAGMRAEKPAVRVSDAAATDHLTEAAGEAREAAVAITGPVLATVGAVKRGSAGSSDGGGMSPIATRYTR